MVDALRERLLSVMDRKNHWAWPHFTRPGLTKVQLAIHFRHEYHTYVRDFPVLLARVLGQGPPEDVRSALAENVFEEQTGKLSLGVSHPELFLEMMEALGIDHLEARYPKETSLGEQQRAAVARALVLSPTLVLADEPTGHQDAVSERRVLDAFAQAAAAGAACLIATHNEALSARLDRVLRMADGRLTESASA